MTTTADELTVARSWIGTTEEAATFNERFDRLYANIVVTVSQSDTVRRSDALSLAIEESIRSQLSAMTLDQPSSASAEGNSYSNVQNMVVLKEILEKFMATKGSSRTGISRLRRNIGR